VGIHEAALREAQEKVQRIDAWQAEHDSLSEALPNLESRKLAGLRDEIAAFLADLPDEVVARTAEGSPELDVLAKRFAGLRAKVKYLGEMQNSQLDPMLNQLNEKIAKLDSDIQRFSDPRKRNARFRDEVFQQRFRDRSDYYDGYWNRYSRGYDLVWEFDAYERMRFTEEVLWWDLMTAGRMDGRMLPSVVEYRGSHPDYTFDRSILRDDDSSAAAAVAEESVNDGDLTTDVS
jgi:hypothetical protein